MFKLVQTCGACPEQYDDPTEMVGYLRLRHGHFRAEHMDQVVYESPTRGDGAFDEDERSYHLNQACLALKDALNNDVEVEYEIERDESGSLDKRKRDCIMKYLVRWNRWAVIELGFAGWEPEEQSFLSEQEAIDHSIRLYEEEDVEDIQVLKYITDPEDVTKWR
jgi:hypothetical protein